MPKKSVVLLPETEEILEQMGTQIKYARLRRRRNEPVSAGRLCVLLRREHHLWQ